MDAIVATGTVSSLVIDAQSAPKPQRSERLPSGLCHALPSSQSILARPGHMTNQPKAAILDP